MASRSGPVHVVTTRRTYKGKVYQSHLLRRSYREDGKVKNETVGNLSHLPDHVVDLVRRALRGESFVGEGDLDVVQSRGHGHVSLVLGLARQLGFDRVLHSRRCRERDIALALIVGRVLAPGSKLASVRGWANTTLLEELDLGEVTVDEVYRAMDWLVGRQDAIQRALVQRHLPGGALVLYDVSSSYVTGTRCGLARHGYSRDHRSDLPQVVFGVVTDADGRPVAVEVYEGNRKDCTTLLDQVERLRKHYKLRRMVLVGDRGMVTEVQIEALRAFPNIDWITALTNGQVADLRDSGALQLGLFDERNLLRITSSAHTDQRLVACRNADLARLRAATRNKLLERTEARLRKIQASVEAGRLRGEAAIGERLGRAWQGDKMRKHFTTTITERSFAFQRNEDAIAAEAALDGIYVIRSSMTADRSTWTDEDLVRAYKGLARVERVFRSLKTTRLLVRPIYHRADDRVRSHIFLCTLAAHLVVELERRLAPLLFVDPGLAETRQTRDPVTPPGDSPEGARKKQERLTADGDPVQSLTTLLAAMATLTRSTLQVRDPSGRTSTFQKDATPTPWQAKVLAAALTAT
jgi:hypothetical protein